MRRKVIYKSTAIKAVVIVFALLMIMSLFPLRIWQRDIPFGAEFTEAEETVSVNDYHDVVQKFDAYYDRLSSRRITPRWSSSRTSISSRSANTT